MPLARGGVGARRPSPLPSTQYLAPFGAVQDLVHVCSSTKSTFYYPCLVYPRLGRSRLLDPQGLAPVLAERQNSPVRPNARQFAHLPARPPVGHRGSRNPRRSCFRTSDYRSAREPSKIQDLHFLRISTRRRQRRSATEARKVQDLQFYRISPRRRPRRSAIET